MKANYEVREYRGAGIEYVVFQGSHEECEQWLRNNCHEEAESMGDTNWISNDPSCVNGSGFTWKYFIYVSIEK